MKNKIDFDPQICLDFWHGIDTGRPLITFWIGSFMIPDLYPHSMQALPDGLLTPDQLSIETFENDYHRLYVNNLSSNADSPWSAFPLMTIPWLEAILGCPIKKKGNQIWAEPKNQNLEHFLSDEIDLGSNPWMDKLTEITNWLIDYSANRFPVSVSLLRGPSDILSALRGPAQMCLDLVDFPDLMLKILEQLTDLWLKICWHQLDLIPPFESGFSFGQIYLWGQDKCAWFQDDALALLSPPYYQHFLLPFEKKIASSLPISGIHLHPRSLFVIDDLVNIPELDVIEINYEPSGPSLEVLLPSFQKVLNYKSLVIWGEFSKQELVFLKNHLPTRKLSLQINVNSSHAARLKLSQVEDIWKDSR